VGEGAAPYEPLGAGDLDAVVAVGFGTWPGVPLDENLDFRCDASSLPNPVRALGADAAPVLTIE